MEGRAEKLAKLRELGRRRDHLLTELEDSLMLRDLWPEVFAHGPVKVHFEGNNYGGSTKRMRYVITRPDGERREWPFDELPEPLKSRLPRLTPKTWMEKR